MHDRMDGEYHNVMARLQKNHGFQCSAEPGSRQVPSGAISATTLTKHSPRIMFRKGSLYVHTSVRFCEDEDSFRKTDNLPVCNSRLVTPGRLIVFWWWIR